MPKLFKNCRVVNLSFYLILIVSNVSCSEKEFGSEKELWAYVKEDVNGYHYQKSVGTVSYSLTYRPTDILVMQELSGKLSNIEIDSLRKKYDEYLYFNLSISSNGQELLNERVGNKGAFGNLVNQLAFGMGEKVDMISSKRDTLALLDYVYPRMYGMGNNTNMLLVYPKEKSLLNQEYFHFTIEDLGFSTGEVSFKVKTAPIKDQPRLKFDKIL